MPLKTCRPTGILKLSLLLVYLSFDTQKNELNIFFYIHPKKTWDFRDFVLSPITKVTWTLQTRHNTEICNIDSKTVEMVLQQLQTYYDLATLLIIKFSLRVKHEYVECVFIMSHTLLEWIYNWGKTLQLR